MLLLLLSLAFYLVSAFVCELPERLVFNIPSKDTVIEPAVCEVVKACLADNKDLFIAEAAKVSTFSDITLSFSHDFTSLDTTVLMGITPAHICANTSFVATVQATAGFPELNGIQIYTNVDDARVLRLTPTLALAADYTPAHAAAQITKELAAEDLAAVVALTATAPEGTPAPSLLASAYGANLDLVKALVGETLPTPASSAPALNIIGDFDEQLTVGGSELHVVKPSATEVFTFLTETFKTKLESQDASGNLPLHYYLLRDGAASALKTYLALTNNTQTLYRKNNNQLNPIMNLAQNLRPATDYSDVLEAAISVIGATLRDDYINIKNPQGENLVFAMAAQEQAVLQNILVLVNTYGGNPCQPNEAGNLPEEIADSEPVVNYLTGVCETKPAGTWYEFNDVDGTGEFVPCEAGYQCPNLYTRTICPAKFYCPAGTAEPIKCSTANEEGAFECIEKPVNTTLWVSIFVVALVIVVGGSVWAMVWYWKKENRLLCMQCARNEGSDGEAEMVENNVI